MGQESECRVLLARSAIAGQQGGIAAPGSAATITLFDSSTVSTWQRGLPFNRIAVNIYASHDSGANGLVFSSSFDRGANFRTQSTQTYLNANGATTYDYLMKGGQVKTVYTNSANVLTAWEMEIFGVYDRNPGA